MKFKIIETINTVSWSEGKANAPADLIIKAKQLDDEGKPAIFGKIENSGNWVVLSVLGVDNENLLYVAHRAG